LQGAGAPKGAPVFHLSTPTPSSGPMPRRETEPRPLSVEELEAVAEYHRELVRSRSILFASVDVRHFVEAEVPRLIATARRGARTPE